ncbi:MAG: chemotaxis protein methyltransferase CheR, partial [Rhizobacter sp.]|nr:chemotaxis protein methyltransferase CheR [Rhizobacter sp.]
MTEMAEALGDALWVGVPSTGRFVSISPRLRDWLGAAAPAALNDMEAWQGVVDSGTVSLKTSRPGLAKAQEFRIDRPEGGVRWLRQRRFSMDGGTESDREYGLVEDITDRMLVQQQTADTLFKEQQSRRDAQAQSATKDELISVVSHDLRSPLNAIRGWAHVLKLSNSLSAPQERALDAIDRNITAQARMVDDLLDSQRILRGKLQLALGEQVLAALVDEAVATIRDAAQAKRIDVSVSHDPTITTVTADADRLRQALANLLSNSLKFTSEGGSIQVTTSRSGSGLHIDIQDDGIGLAPNQLAHV